MYDQIQQKKFNRLTKQLKLKNVGQSFHLPSTEYLAIELAVVHPYTHIHAFCYTVRVFASK